MFAIVVIREFMHEIEEERLRKIIKKQQRRLELQSDKINKHADTIGRLSRKIRNQHKTIVWLSENRQREE